MWMDSSVWCIVCLWNKARIRIERRIMCILETHEGRWLHRYIGCCCYSCSCLAYRYTICDMRCMQADASRRCVVSAAASGAFRACDHPASGALVVRAAFAIVIGAQKRVRSLSGLATQFERSKAVLLAEPSVDALRNASCDDAILAPSGAIVCAQRCWRLFVELPDGSRVK